ncbi:MAG: glycosyl hydrolase family 18 protein [Rhodanobacteraceae bacterium]
MPLKVLQAICTFACLVLCMGVAQARGTVPTFTRSIQGVDYTFAGHDPAVRGTTSIPVLLVPIELDFSGHATKLAAGDTSRILKSPVFSSYPFPGGTPTQYADALMRATFPGGGRTLLGTPEVRAVTIDVPPSKGYLLHAGGRSFGVIDRDYIESQLFRQIPAQPGKLVIAVVHNATFYAIGDATVCCGWGSHGVDPGTGNSFVLSAYLDDAPAIVSERDVQPLTQQLAEFFYDPLHDPRNNFHTDGAPGNWFAAWQRPAPDGACGGSGIGSNYFQLLPTDTNPKNNFPSSPAYVASSTGGTYHVQNVALFDWYLGGNAGSKPYSFPDIRALREPAKACARGRSTPGNQRQPVAAPVGGVRNKHWLIGYWTGSRFGGGTPLPLQDVSPQWDVVLVAFASPAANALEGTLVYSPPPGMSVDDVKAGIAWLQRHGRKVMISLGGGGKYFKLDHASDIPNFVDSVASIVKQYGFDGVDIDFEAPSLDLADGDSDFRHPTTPSVVNLIEGLRQLHRQFGPKFMISIVPEGTQVPGGYVSYGGQFGSELPLIYALKDILAFVDVQNYNTPPLTGLDGNIYQTHTVDYYAATTDMLLHGFDVAGNPKMFFPPLPADKVAVGFLVGYDDPGVDLSAVRYVLTGHAPAGTGYRLRSHAGYPAMLGAMYWTIDEDRDDGCRYSNLLGPELHGHEGSMR